MQFLRHLNRLVQFFLVRVGHRQSMEGIHVVGILSQRSLIGGNGLVEPILGKKLHPFVVVIFLAHRFC